MLAKASKMIISDEPINKSTRSLEFFRKNPSEELREFFF
jgi:hypothetical protein